MKVLQDFEINPKKIMGGFSSEENEINGLSNHFSRHNTGNTNSKEKKQLSKFENEDQLVSIDKTDNAEHTNTLTEEKKSVNSNDNNNIEDSHANDEVDTKIAIKEEKKESDSDDENDDDSCGDDSDDEDSGKNLNIKTTDIKEVTDVFEKLEITKKEKKDEEKEEIISRAPMKGYEYTPSCDPYPQPIRSHVHQAGGYVIANISSENYNITNVNNTFHQEQYPESNLPSVPLSTTLDEFESPLSPWFDLDERYYLEDEIESQFLPDLNNTTVPKQNESAQTVPELSNRQRVTVVPNNMNIMASYENQGCENTVLGVSGSMPNVTYNSIVTTQPQITAKKIILPSSPAQSDTSELLALSPSTNPYREPSPFSSTDGSSSSDISSNCSSPCSSTYQSCSSPYGSDLFDLTLLMDGTSVALPNLVVTNSSSSNPQHAMNPQTVRMVNVNAQAQVPVKAERRTPVQTSGTGYPEIRMEPETPRLEPRTALERMNLDSERKRQAFFQMAMRTDEDLSMGDDDNDTKLMIMIAKNLPKGYEYLYALVKRLQNIPGALEARNKQNQSALLLSCLFMPHDPLVARFIAEALDSINHDLNEVYDNGNTILHKICELGDEYCGILVEFLSMRKSNGERCFDIHRHNHSEGTPLLVAVKSHREGKSCSRIVTCLVSQGAELTERVCQISI